MRTRRSLAHLSLAVCLAVGLLGCSDDDGGGGAGGAAPSTSIPDLLGLAPDTPEVRGSEIYYTNLERVRTGLPAPADAIDDLITISNASSYQANVPQRYSRCISSEECLVELGWDTRSVNAWIEFGEVGARTEVLVGSFSANAIESAIRNGPAKDTVSVSSAGGATIIRIGTEDETNLEQRSGYSPIGRGVTVAVTDSMLVSSDFEADVLAVLSRTREQSMAVDPGYAAIASALDQAQANHVVINAGLRGSTWLVGGFGEVVTADDDGTTADPAVVTYAFVFADNTAAQAGDAAFRTIVETGESERTAMRWSDRLTITSSSVDGTVLVVTMQSDAAGLWLRPLLTADSLLIV